MRNLMTMKHILIAGLIAMLAPSTTTAANTCDSMWGRMPSAVVRRTAKAYGRWQRHGPVTMPTSVENGEALGASPVRFRQEIERVWKHAKVTKLEAYCAGMDAAQAADDVMNAAALPLIRAFDAQSAGIPPACLHRTVVFAGKLTVRLDRFGKPGARQDGLCPEALVIDLPALAADAAGAAADVRAFYLDLRSGR